MPIDANTQGLEHLTAAYSSQSYNPAYVQTLSQKEMQDRSLPALLAQKGLELVNMVMGAGVSNVYGGSIEDMAKEHWMIGNKAYHEGDLLKAIDEYNKSIKMDPSNSQYYNDLGVVYAVQNKDEEAIGYYKKAIEVNKNLDSVTYYNLAKSYRFLAESKEKEGKNKDAISLFILARSYYEDYIRIDPNGKMVKSAKNLINAIDTSFLPRLE